MNDKKTDSPFIKEIEAVSEHLEELMKSMDDGVDRSIILIASEKASETNNINAGILLGKARQAVNSLAAFAQEKKTRLLFAAAAACALGVGDDK